MKDFYLLEKEEQKQLVKAAIPDMEAKAFVSIYKQRGDSTDNEQYVRVAIVGKRHTYYRLTWNTTEGKFTNVEKAIFA